MKRVRHLTDPVELLYLALMLRWEKTAPPDGHLALLDGKPERNTQITRLAYVLRKISAGNDEGTYSSLARYTRRQDGRSYVSKEPSWMIAPYPLAAGWHFEGCTSLEQKRDIILSLIKLGLSASFVACVDDFVAGRTVADYLPTKAEQEEIFKRIEERSEESVAFRG